MLESDDYRSILLQNVPLIDTRAPVEFTKGTLPNATNLPLMMDDERAQVGTCYKQQGKNAAIELGHRLVSGITKDQRVEAWRQFAQQHPQGYLYCFRGGLRSKISQQWLHDAGVDYPRIKGGYKAVRRFLITQLEHCIHHSQFTVLTGLTGTGKTDILTTLDFAIDLEHLANHRGSSFGKHALAQPSQINFENQLALRFLQQQQQNHRHLVLENESRLIGTCALPLPLQHAMKQSALVVLECDINTRIERILRDYVINLREEFVAQQGEQQGAYLFAQQLQQSLANIAKRLGGERYHTIANMLNDALTKQQQSGEVALHRLWIRCLLEQYYDPMYHYQRDKNRERIIFSGDHRAVTDFLQHLHLQR